ncbi:MAG: carbohydrate ABC transporter permease [Clostridiaceae bacterium]|nr:carbohydrate ABC transporter permease [Clostridiaceae bacterium]
MKKKQAKPAAKVSVCRLLLYFFSFFWALMTIFPLLLTFLSSMKNNVEINLGMFNLPRTWRFENYVEAVRSANIVRAVGNSIFLSVMATLLLTVIGIMVSYVLSRKKFVFIKPMYSLFMVGIMVPVHCAIIPISTLAGSLHAKNQYWFLILVYVAFNISQAVFLYTGFINGINKEIDEAALIDGCDDFKLLSRIMLPMCKPIISTEAIFMLTYCYGELIFALTLLSDADKYTMSRALLSFTGNHSISYGPIFASIIIAVLPMVVLYITFHEKVQAGMMAGAVKG